MSLLAELRRTVRLYIDRPKITGCYGFALCAGPFVLSVTWAVPSRWDAREWADADGGR